MIRRWVSRLFSSFLFINFVRRYKSRSSLMKIKAARMYVLGVKKTRFFFLGTLLVLISLIFLINGLSLVQAAFFTYSMWSSEMKFIVALSLGGIEFLGATGILIYLFREETWSKFTGIHHVVNFAIKEEGKDNKIRR
jgi:hypothetical protein